MYEGRTSCLIVTVPGHCLSLILYMKHMFWVPRQDDSILYLQHM